MKTKKIKKCYNKTIKNKHRGNTFSDIKYAIHCKNMYILKKSIEILENIGFKIFKRERYGMYHTFLKPSSKILNSNNFYLVLVIKKGGNNQKVITDKIQGPHLGFKIKNSKIFESIYNKICNITKTILIDKPDEKSLFIDLLCGEIIELSIKK